MNKPICQQLKSFEYKYKFPLLEVSLMYYNEQHVPALTYITQALNTTENFQFCCRFDCFLGLNLIEFMRAY